MNIFYLDNCPTLAATALCDKHVVKMIVETAQLLSTAHRKLDGDELADAAGLYRSTHASHPSAVWVRSSAASYLWTHRLLVALCSEYTTRYCKTHKTEGLVGPLAELPANIPLDLPFCEPPQCMPDQYRTGGSVDAYRAYYYAEKLSQPWAKYAYTPAPGWA